MLRFFIFLLVSIIIPTLSHATPVNELTEWNIKPYVSVMVGQTFYKHKQTDYEIHHWRHWVYPEADWYFLYPDQKPNKRGKIADEKLEFGVSLEGDITYESIGVFVVMVGGDYSVGVTPKVGFKIGRLTPYVHFPFNLYRQSDYIGDVGCGFGLSIKIIDGVYWDTEYATTFTHTKGSLDIYRYRNEGFMLATGYTMGREEQMEFWNGRQNYRLPDETETIHKYTTHTIRTGIKITF